MQTIYVSPNFPLNRWMRKAILRGKLNVVREGDEFSTLGGGMTRGGLRPSRTFSSPLVCMVERDGEKGGEVIPKSHVWRQIEDMPTAFNEKAQTAEKELRVLANVWREQELQFDPEQLAKFNRELNREWAIETGLIERAYHLERGITQILIEQGIEKALIPHHSDQDPADVFRMLRDHEHVIEGLFDFVANRRELSVGYVKELHAEMLRTQKTVAGVDQFGNKTHIPMNHGLFKKRPNSPFTPEGTLHEYCPWEQVGSEMDRLIKMHKTHLAHPPLAQTAWLHHRFVQIHPFEDGNGRIARCLATLVFIRAKWFPLVVPNEERDDYLDALQAADNGDLSPLICCFAKWQKRYFFKVMGIAGHMRDTVKRENPTIDRKLPRDSSIEEQIDTLSDFLAQKGQQQKNALAKQHNTAIKTAEALYGLACERLQDTATQIADKLGENGRAWANWASGNDDKGHYYRHQTVETAKALEYYANTDVHRAWARMVLQVADERAMLLLFFHGTGMPYRGIIACAACFIMRRRSDASEEERRGKDSVPLDNSESAASERSTWHEKEPVPLGNGVFQINYQEEESQAVARFQPWLNEVIRSALEMAQQEF